MSKPVRGTRIRRWVAQSILYLASVRARLLALASRSASGKRRIRPGSEFHNPLFLFALARLSSASTSTSSPGEGHRRVHVVGQGIKQRTRSFFETISLSRCTGIEGNFFCLLSRNRWILTKAFDRSLKSVMWFKSPPILFTFGEHFRLYRAAGDRYSNSS